MSFSPQTRFIDLSNLTRLAELQHRSTSQLPDVLTEFISAL
jgi:hypothetical protein